MISTESFSKEWIEGVAQQYGYHDKELLEKVIRAFALLETLVDAGAPLTFKGGSSIFLLLKDNLNRLSIDVDVICRPIPIFFSISMTWKSTVSFAQFRSTRSTPGRNFRQATQRSFMKWPFPIRIPTMLSSGWMSCTRITLTPTPLPSLLTCLSLSKRGHP